MRGIKLLSILLLISVTMLSGCSKKSPAPQAVKAKVQPGGQLVYGSQYEPNSLNPLLSDFIATAEVGRLIFSGLVMTDDKGQWIPDLAIEVPTVKNGGVSPDGRRITYKLRTGVTWHDGTPFTAEDVKFTWQVIMNRRVNVLSTEGYDKIASIVAPDPNTVIVNYREYYAPYLTLFSTILPKHLFLSVEDINKAEFNRAPIGTGPFKFEEWQVGQAIKLKANPVYYRGKPILDSIVYKIIPDANILLTQIKAGQVNVISNVPFTQLEQAKALNNANTLITPNMIWEHLDFNFDNMHFKDVRVRKAVMLAIDRQAIVDTTLKRVGAVAVSDQSALSWGYNSAIQAPARDVNAARALLEQAGYAKGADGIYVKNGQKLSFSITTNKDNKVREAVGRKISEQLREAGIKADINLVDLPVFFGDVLKYRKFDMAFYAWVSGIDPDNISLWNSKYIPSWNNGYSGQNYSGWRNSEVDMLTVQALQVVDADVRKQLYYRLQDILVEDCPVIPLYYRANIDVVTNNVANIQPNPTPSGNLWNAWQWGFVK